MATTYKNSATQAGFYGATPVSKAGSTNDIKDSLVSLGLITDGGATPLNLDGGTATAGRVDTPQIKTDTTTPTDLTITTGAAKTAVLATSVYDDIIFPTVLGKLGEAATNPELHALFGNVQAYTFAINDLVYGSMEIPHNYKEGEKLDVHCHIITHGAEAGVEVRYSFEYWIADSGEASTTTNTITSADKALTNADGHHEYVDIGDITMTNFKIGACICFVFKRVALADGSNPANDPFVVSIGAHYAIDTMGSRSEATK